MYKLLKNRKGITLIALVITIMLPLLDRWLLMDA